MSKEVVKKELTPLKKSNLISLLIGVGIMIVASIITIVAFTVTYKFVTKPNDFDDVFGPNYQEELLDKGTENDVNYEIYKVGNKGFVLVGEKHHAFDPGTGEVSGFIGFKIAIDADGEIKAYAFTKYDHSGDNWRATVEAYLEAFVGTKIDDVEQTHTSSVNDGVTAGATETSVNTVYPILQVLKEVR